MEQKWLPHTKSLSNDIYIPLYSFSLSLTFFSNLNGSVQLESLKLTTEMIRLFVVEAIHRASAVEKQEEGYGVVTQEHLEKVLAELMLDFL
jgi:hypothetical protein